MINAFVNEIINGLKADGGFSEYIIHSDYPADVRPNPIKKVHICVGTEDIKIYPCSVDGKSSVSSNDKKLCADIEVSIKIMVPHYIGGEMCDKVLSKLISYFYFGSVKNYPESIKSLRLRTDSYSDCFIKRVALGFNCLLN